MLVRERIIYQRFIWFLTIPRFRWPEENAGSTIRDSTSPKLHSTVEKPRNDALITGPFSTTIVCQQFRSPEPTFRSPRSLSKGRAAERISRTKRNGERIFCFEYKTKEKNFSAYKKSCSSCFWLYALNSASIPILLLPIAFLMLCVSLLLVMKENLFTTEKSLYTTTNTHDRRIIPVLIVPESFHLENCNWKESWAWWTGTNLLEVANL